MLELKMPDAPRARDFFEAKVSFTTGPMEVQHYLEEEEDVVIVDVRERKDFNAAHVPGAINLPIEKWEHPEGLSKSKTNILYCYSQQCHLAAKAALKWAAEGYPVMEMEGGFEAWKNYKLATESATRGFEPHHDEIHGRLPH